MYFKLLSTCLLFKFEIYDPQIENLQLQHLTERVPTIRGHTPNFFCVSRGRAGHARRTLTVRSKVFGGND